MSESSAERVAVVVGGASGIGWAVATGLKGEGYRVVVADLNATGARQRADELGAPHTWAAVDVTDEDTVAALFEQAGSVNVVVNTAGSATSAGSPNWTWRGSARSSTAA